MGGEHPRKLGLPCGKGSDIPGLFQIQTLGTKLWCFLSGLVQRPSGLQEPELLLPYPLIITPSTTSISVRCSPSSTDATFLSLTLCRANLDESSRFQFLERQTYFFFGVHHDGTPPGYRFVERFSRKKEYAKSLCSAFNGDLITVLK